MPTPFIRTTRSLELDSARGSLAIGVIAMLCLVLWLGWFLFGAVTIFEVSKSARLEAGASPRDVSAVQAGRMIRSTLVVGRRVQAGDVLVELDATAARLALIEAETRLTLLPERAASLRREIATTSASLGDDRRAAGAAVATAEARQREARAQADLARETERRMRAQAQAGGVSEMEALRASAEARRAASANEALTAEARRLASDGRVRAGEGASRLEVLRRDLLAVENEITETETEVQRLQAGVEALVIRAPVDGVVGEVSEARPGAVLSEGQKLATIIPAGRVVILAGFDPSTGLGRIAPGQRARMRLDGFPWSQYGVVDATVARTAGDVRDGKMSVELTPHPGPRAAGLMRHGLTGVVEVEIERVSPAQLVVRAAGQAVYPARQPVTRKPAP